MKVPRLGDVVEVVESETVVRLDGTTGRLAQLVLTGDVVGSLSSVVRAAGDGPQSAADEAVGTGAAFFVVGPFGSGKSHFLAAVGELLANPQGAVRTIATAAGWPDELRRDTSGARPSLAVPVPLVEYRARARLEDVVEERAWRTLGQEPPGPSDDRAATWEGFLSAVLASGRAGVVLLLDELSEFLRAKQGPSLTEDLRFLQFLGEWCAGRPVVVVAALQESIEEVANVSQKELGRIRDRYRPSLTLSMRHVEDLVHGRLIRTKPGGEGWMREIHQALCAAFPASRVPYEQFTRCYPLHPDTLRLLEGLRFLFSQQRGVVDFVCRSVRASLEDPASTLVTPDRVYDHFAGRLHERPETARLAATVVPYYERALDELVSADDRELALRTVKLLVLLAASPLERPRTAAELAAMLGARMSEVDPSANAAYLEAVVLRPAVERGAYVVAHPGPPPTYEVDAAADAALVFAGRVSQVRAELHPGDRRLVATLSALGSTTSVPLETMVRLGASRRELLWHNTLRSLVIDVARVIELTTQDAQSRVARARSAGAEGCLLVGEIELTAHELADATAAAEAAAAAAGRLVLWLPASPTQDELDTLVDLHARRQVVEDARRSGHSELVEVGERAAEADVSLARDLVRRLYFDGTLICSPAGDGALWQDGEVPGGAPVDLPSLAGVAFERLLPRLADPLLSRLHPLHAQLAPRGELVGEHLLRRLVYDVLPLSRIPAAAMAQLRPLVEGYLVPLGLARSRKDGATIAPDPARSPAVAEVLRRTAGEPVLAQELVADLADGPLGLTAPEALLVLNACVASGLVEMTRGRKRHAEPFLAVTPTDRLVGGELVEPAVRELVSRLGQVFGPGPFDPWTSATQRSAWHYAQAWIEARREELAQVADGLLAMEAAPGFAGADTALLRLDQQAVGRVLEAVGAAAGPAGGAAGPAAGLRALAAAVDDPDALATSARRLSRAARFFRDDLRRVEEAASYLAHPDLCIPEDHEALLSLLHDARRLVADALALASEDRTDVLFSAVREVRGAYLAAYQEAHDRHYSAAGPEAAGAVRSSSAYRALRALSSIGAVAVPDDRVKVDRALTSAVPARCTRRVDQELLWRPLCSCGFRIGDPPPVVDRDALVAMCARGVAEHLAELADPEVHDRLVDAAADLEALGRNELARDLRRLVALAEGSRRQDDAEGASGGGNGDPTFEELASLLGEDLRRTVADVLAGTQLIVTRDLAALREDLIGRRYPKRRLVELLQAWVEGIDGTGHVPPNGFVEVVDSADAAGAPSSGAGEGEGAARATARGGARRGGNSGFLEARWPSLAAQLPADRRWETFWLAAWWSEKPGAPPWLPAGLLAQRDQLTAAAQAACSDPEALAALAELDQRVRPGTVLGDQLEAALDLAEASAVDVLRVLTDESLLRHPVQLACNALLRRLGGDWQVVARLGRPDLAAVEAAHALLGEGELAALALAFEAAGHLAEVERRLPDASGAELVEDLYADHAASVTGLLSRAEVAAASGSLVDPEAVVAVAAAARRLLGEADAAFRRLADSGFPGCLALWDVGRTVVQPLLDTHGRVAVLLVDALRADLGVELAERIRQQLPGRTLSRRWAVVPAPTRTAEALAALATGAPVPAGAATQPSAGSSPIVPFAHLGYEASVLLGADRDHQAAALRRLWTDGPPLSVAVATGIDERLHRTSAELAGLLSDALSGLERRIVPSLSVLPDEVPLLVLADHGFRENPSWGLGPDGRYAHGGTSLEECVVPVITAVC